VLASTGADGQLRLWSTKDWTEASAVKIQNGGVLQIAFAPRSGSVTVAADHLLQTFSVKNGKFVERVEVNVQRLYGVAISPDGKYLQTLEPMAESEFGSKRQRSLSSATATGLGLRASATRPSHG
jgi:WD40 repeat protein